MATAKIPVVGDATAVTGNADSAASANTFFLRDGSANGAVNALTVAQLIATSAQLGVSNKTSTFTASATESVFYTVDSSGGAVTVNLPAAASSTNQVFVIFIKTAGNNVVLDGNSSETINGATTKTNATQYSSAILFCNGSAWFAIFVGTWT